MYKDGKEDNVSPQGDLKNQVAGRIKEFRSQIGLSVLEMATLLDKGAPAIYAIEQGRVFPQLDDLALLQDRFGLDLNWLISGDGNPTLWNGNTTDLSDNLKGLIAALRADPSNEELANKVDQQLTFTLNELEKLDIVRKIIKST